MPIQLHIQKMKREADVIKKNEKSANEYLTQTKHIPALFFTLFLRYNTNKLIGFNTGYPLANYSTNE